MKYWVAKDKDGTIHLSNVKPIKPSDYYRGTDMYPSIKHTMLESCDIIRGNE